MRNRIVAAAPRREAKFLPNKPRNLGKVSLSSGRAPMLRRRTSVSLAAASAAAPSGPIAVDDPRGAFADDQLGLMDHLGVQFFFMGYRIGGPFALKLMERAPDCGVAGVPVVALVQAARGPNRQHAFARGSRVFTPISFNSPGMLVGLNLSARTRRTKERTHGQHEKRDRQPRRR
jgi:pimeloyl-ACP methyl ester carboxylesterase